MSRSHFLALRSSANGNFKDAQRVGPIQTAVLPPQIGLASSCGREQKSARIQQMHRFNALLACDDDLALSVRCQ